VKLKDTKTLNSYIFYHSSVAVTLICNCHGLLGVKNQLSLSQFIYPWLYFVMLLKMYSQSISRKGLSTTLFCPFVSIVNTLFKQRRLLLHPVPSFWPICFSDLLLFCVTVDLACYVRVINCTEVRFCFVFNPLSHSTRVPLRVVWHWKWKMYELCLLTPVWCLPAGREEYWLSFSWLSLVRGKQRRLKKGFSHCFQFVVFTRSVDVVRQQIRSYVCDKQIKL